MATDHDLEDGPPLEDAVRCSVASGTGWPRGTLGSSLAMHRSWHRLSEECVRQYMLQRGCRAQESLARRTQNRASRVGRGLELLRVACGTRDDYCRYDGAGSVRRRGTCITVYVAVGHHWSRPRAVVDLRDQSRRADDGVAWPAGRLDMGSLAVGAFGLLEQTHTPTHATTLLLSHCPCTQAPALDAGTAVHGAEP